jgi:hypothetical protein
MDTTLSAGQGHEHIKTFTIIVNLEEKTVIDHKLSFDQLVKLAFPTPPPGDITYTITYTKGEGKKSGILNEGESVPVKDGMSFDVTPTNRS